MDTALRSVATLVVEGLRASGKGPATSRRYFGVN